MVTRIITETLCTVCFQTDEGNTTEATFTGTVQVGELRRSLDLCAEHYEKLIGNLPETLETYGQPVTTPSSTAAPTSRAVHPDSSKERCSICGGLYMPQGMALHRRRAHGVTRG